MDAPFPQAVKHFLQKGRASNQVLGGTRIHNMRREEGCFAACWTPCVFLALQTRAGGHDSLIEIVGSGACPWHLDSPKLLFFVQSLLLFFGVK